MSATSINSAVTTNAADTTSCTTTTTTSTTISFYYDHDTYISATLIAINTSTNKKLILFLLVPFTVVTIATDTNLTFNTTTTNVTPTFRSAPPEMGVGFRN